MACDDTTTETTTTCNDLGLSEATPTPTGCCKNINDDAPATDDDTEARNLCCQD